MAQYVYTMRRVSKTVPPQRTILKNISLNFFPGAKIGVLGLNGSGKSSLLKIMAGEDKNYDLTFVDGSLDIAKAQATVTANSKNVTYNGATQSVSGLPGVR